MEPTASRSPAVPLDAAAAPGAPPATTRFVPPAREPSRFLRAPARPVLGGLAVGAVAGWALDFEPLGVGFFVAALAFAALLLRLGGREGLGAARGHRWLVAGALAFAGFVAVRDSGFLVFLDVCAAAALLVLALRGWSGARPVADAQPVDVLAAPFLALGHGLDEGVRLTAAAARTTPVGGTLRAVAWPAVRVLLVAGPVVGFVTLLLASGDASFGERLTRAWSALGAVPFGALLRIAVVAAVAGPFAVGLVGWALARRDVGPARAPAALTTVLGAPEGFGLVGGLAVVMAAFGLVSAECALSPGACVLPAGVTYSSWAREGFFELVVAGAITLFVLVVVPARTKLASVGHQRALRLLATALVVATLPMLASAFRRMALYEAAYGFTQLRVWSQAADVLIALMLAWRAVTLWTAPHRFVVGAVASAALCLGAMNVLDPDAFIARKNVEAALSGQRALDASYLTRLSDDAVPAVVAAVNHPRLRHDRRALCASSMLWRVGQTASLPSFNLARARAARLVGENAACFEEREAWPGEGARGPAAQPTPPAEAPRPPPPPQRSAPWEG